MHPNRNLWRNTLFTLLLAGFGLATLPALASSNNRSKQTQTIPARAVQYKPAITGFGRVTTAAPIWLRAGESAQVTHVGVSLGEAIQPDQILLTLGGPLLAPRLADARESRTTAAKNLQLIRDAAASAKSRYPAFTDRMALDRARANVLQAKSALTTANTCFTRLNGITNVRAQISGHVTAIAVTAGMGLQAGAQMIQIVPKEGILLHAEFFPLGWTPTAGVQGLFYPLQGGKPIKVRVTAVAPGFNANSGRELWLTTVDRRTNHAWVSGESGRIVLQAAARAAVQIPVEALVLDHSRWWVMVKQHGKLQARSVELAPDGATTGTVIKGLKPGELVVVRDSYRLFHRDFAQHYMPPD